MVMRLFAPQFLILWAFVASTIAVHFRGKVRLGFWRQFTDHSTLMAPYNVLMYLFSAVPNQPILDEASIPELKALRDNWQPAASSLCFWRQRLLEVPRWHCASPQAIRSRHFSFCERM